MEPIRQRNADARYRFDYRVWGWRLRSGDRDRFPALVPVRPHEGSDVRAIARPMMDETARRALGDRLSRRTEPSQLRPR